MRREILGALTAAGYTLGTTLEHGGPITWDDLAVAAGAAILGWLGVWVMPSRGAGDPPQK